MDFILPMRYTCTTNTCAMTAYRKIVYDLVWKAMRHGARENYVSLHCHKPSKPSTNHVSEMRIYVLVSGACVAVCWRVQIVSQSGLNIHIFGLYRKTQDLNRAMGKNVRYFTQTRSINTISLSLYLYHIHVYNQYIFASNTCITPINT